MRRLERLAQASPWRARPPAEKLVLAGGLLALSLILPPWPGAAMVLAAAVTLALAGARTPPADYGALLAVPAGFLAAGSLVLAISVRPWGDGPLLAVSGEGLATATDAALRAMAATAALLLLAVTTPVTDLLALLRRAGLPAALVDVVLLVYRFSALLWETAVAGRRAQAGRLGHVGWRRSLRSTGRLAAHLLPRAMDRARRLQIGLDARGWTGELRVLAPRRPTSAGFLAGALLLHAAIAAAALIAPLAGCGRPPW